MPRKPVIAVIGTGRDIEPAVTHAREMGKLIARNGWVLINGGRDAGVMKAASEGAKAAGGLTIGILPDRDAKISPDVDVAIVTDTGEARNNIIVLSADVVVGCGVDGAGTLSEIALAIKNGKRVMLLGVSREAGEFFSSIGGDQIIFTRSPEETVQIINKIRLTA